MRLSEHGVTDLEPHTTMTCSWIHKQDLLGAFFVSRELVKFIMVVGEGLGVGGGGGGGFGRGGFASFGAVAAGRRLRASSGGGRVADD